MSIPHRSRRLALQALCCVDAQGPSAWQSIEEFVRDSREPSQVLDQALEILHAAFDAREQCDELLARHAHRWDLPRLALVDRNILRLAAWELVADKTPFKVAISESLKLASEFSSAEAPRFINGVLDALARELREGPADVADELPVDGVSTNADDEPTEAPDA